MPASLRALFLYFPDPTEFSTRWSKLSEKLADQAESKHYAKEETKPYSKGEIKRYSKDETAQTPQEEVSHTSKRRSVRFSKENVERIQKCLDDPKFWNIRRKLSTGKALINKVSNYEIRMNTI